MRTRICTTILGCLLGGLLLAAPAFGQITAVGTLAGTAEVGQWFVSDDPCGELGSGTTQGAGVAPLTAPTPHSREGSWHLDTELFAAGQNQGGPGVFTGTIEICGRLDREPVTDHGPVCGISKGFAGQGRAFVFDQLAGQLVELRLSEFGWKEQVGALLPVIGTFERLDQFGNPTGDAGTAVALVAVAPSVNAIEQCGGLVAGNGVKSFEVIASFALSSGPQVDWNDVTHYVVPKTGGDAKSCFDDGPDEKAPATPPASGPGYC